MRKFLPALLVLSVFTVRAQQYRVPASGINPYKTGQTLYQSDLLPIRQSAVFTISPDIEFGRSKHYFFKGLLKTAVAGTVAYKVNQTSAPAIKQETMPGRRGFGLSLGVGLAAGSPDYIKAFGSLRHSKLVYTFYNKKKQPISRKVVKWKGGKTKPVEGIAPEDGFLQVSFINGNKKIMSAGDMFINIHRKNKGKSKSTQLLNTARGGEGGGGNEDPEDAPLITFDLNGIEISFWDHNHNGEIDGYSYADGNGVVIGNVTEYGNFYDYNMSDVLTDYNPDQWGDMDQYLEWYDYYYFDGNEPAPATDTIKNNIIAPCLNNPLTAILNSSNNVIALLIKSVFGSSSSFTLSINQVPYTSQGGPGETHLPLSIGNGISMIQIDLAKYELDGASQEFTAAAILHEMVHAYLLTQPNFPTDLTAQHEYMLQNYTDTIATALQQLYPSLSSDTAISLAMGGYGGIQNNNPTLWDSVVTSHSITDQLISGVNTRHKTGIAGTPCQ
jgi:hypothetical protein